jgi:acyl-lipid omega-6 desaturase (Delta-12 desaturase)
VTAQSAERFPPIETSVWRKAVAPFQKSDLRLSLWQLVNSVCPFFILWYLAYLSLSVSYLLALPLAMLAGLFAVRIFIIFHDCCHGSFFKARWANDLTGYFTGIITFTPYYNWRQTHAIHHATSGDLDRRGVGDIWTLTYEEYQKLPRWQQIGYRIYRNPFVIFGIGPFVDFVIIQRLPASHAAATTREKASVHITTLILLAIGVGMSFTIGLGAYLAIQIPVIVTASTVGVWLFYVQHQYENTYWEHHENWDFAQASLYGSSFYKLPRLLQWFSGNIGFHHIHHLSPRIPNYKLEECYKSSELFQRVEPLTLKSSLKSLFVRVWDEDRHKMMGYHKNDEETETKGTPAPNA